MRTAKGSCHNLLAICRKSITTCLYRLIGRLRERHLGNAYLEEAVEQCVVIDPFCLAVS